MPAPEDRLRSLPSPAQQLLFDFNDSDIKFNLLALMNILRDHNHEGWVLAAYPDPKTRRPLIGAGFSLDVSGTDHPQGDPLNLFTFIEPSSAELWQAAGLDLDRLQRILARFNHDLNAVPKKRHRGRVGKRPLAPELDDAEATSLLRISAIQAVHNARAYCRDFSNLTASQQMALSQLVFQMGVNLEEFIQFLGALNGDDWYTRMSPLDERVETRVEHWRTVQGTLMDSLWARSFPNRATAVIAMFDAEYSRAPGDAERKVEAVLRPPVEHARGKVGRAARAARATTRGTSHGWHAAGPAGKRVRSKRHK